MTWTEVLTKLLADGILLEDHSTGIIQIHPKYYIELGKPIPGTVGRSTRLEKLTVQYIALWPAKILSGGRPVRQGLTSINKKLGVFINQHPKITDKQILDATTRYVKTKQQEQWAYASCSDYFISKGNTSLLETYIENESLGSLEDTVNTSLRNRSL